VWKKRNYSQPKVKHFEVVCLNVGIVMPELSKVIDVTFIFLCVVAVWVGACTSSGNSQKAGEH
jgi:hypothetical protein